MLSSIQFVCIILFNIIHESASRGQLWGYDVQGLPGQDEWYIMFPRCNGRRQSPIDIYTEEAQYDSTLEPFEFEELQYLDGLRMNLKNNGYTVAVDISGRPMHVNGGGLPGTYVVEQFHFHWGSEKDTGSEHELNGYYYPMEMHVVMHSDRFQSIGSAMNSTNGLAVLAFFINIGNHNPHLDCIIQKLKYIRNKGSQIAIPAVDLSSLFPSTQYYYRYDGSLTTPPCYESVVWTIFKEHIYMSASQLNQFHALANGEPSTTGTLVDNFRNPQPLNDRRVRTNYWGNNFQL